MKRLFFLLPGVLLLVLTACKKPEAQPAPVSAQLIVKNATTLQPLAGVNVGIFTEDHQYYRYYTTDVNGAVQIQVDGGDRVERVSANLTGYIYYDLPCNGHLPQEILLTQYAYVWIHAENVLPAAALDQAEIYCPGGAGLLLYGANVDTTFLRSIYPYADSIYCMLNGGPGYVAVGVNPTEGDTISAQIQY